ncbi:coiled-coil domain-containing protein-domain-containing protein [Podospora aff. communis PSN243]|uniref:Coiled-coil domain-containing protein-domain-containing protein n=1 Tax=Podospora aff. communis PSN243 TaxID=3040156 RepID=A0AAV9G4L3_9PEZI|nr:coiled-coil domain-containing protein-domain-containing protein [Podospora aff. communis PSN243]
MAPHMESPPPPPNLQDLFSKPQPRPPRSSSRSEQIRIQNRRREYLHRNPSYFKSSENELADPLLYDTLIRRFLTPAEREADGRAKGYARVLEGSLLRGEERLAKLSREEEARGSGSQSQAPSSACAPAGVVSVDDLPPPKTKSQGREQWEAFLRERFVRGEDEDFEYVRVDMEEEYDVLERTEREEAWFDEETPEWVGEDGEEGGKGERPERILTGETGVQDF